MQQDYQDMDGLGVNQNSATSTICCKHYSNLCVQLIQQPNSENGSPWQCGSMANAHTTCDHTGVQCSQCFIVCQILCHVHMLHNTVLAGKGLQFQSDVGIERHRCRRSDGMCHTPSLSLHYLLSASLAAVLTRLIAVKPSLSFPMSSHSRLDST